VAAREASPHRRGQLEAAVRGFSGKDVPFDAQIDGQGRLRKVRHQFTFAGGTPGGPDGTESGAAGGTGADADNDAGTKGGGGDGGDEGGEGDGRAGVAVASTTWFYAYGAPVEVVMPEPDDIYAGKIAPF
jgi:hypothetical protein